MNDPEDVNNAILVLSFIAIGLWIATVILNYMGVIS